MSLALLVWVGGGLLKRVLYFFGDAPSLGRKSQTLHLPLQLGSQIRTGFTLKNTFSFHHPTKRENQGFKQN